MSYWCLNSGCPQASFTEKMALTYDLGSSPWCTLYSCEQDCQALTSSRSQPIYFCKWNFVFNHCNVSWFDSAVFLRLCLAPPMSVCLSNLFFQICNLNFTSDLKARKDYFFSTCLFKKKPASTL